jgi:hypothetical protein
VAACNQTKSDIFNEFANSVVNGSEPVGEPTLELPTLRSLGVWWAVKGDANQNAKIEFEYRKVGSEAWQKAPDLWRVEKGAHLAGKKKESSAVVPEGAWLFAGSALMLEPATAYELKLTLTDPDGGSPSGSVQKVLKQSTIAEPMAPAGLKEVHVVPGAGGGAGTAADPYKGIPAAMEAIGPGTILLLHKGSYDGPFVIKKSGEPGKPIIWRAAGDGDALIDGKCPPDKREGAAIEIVGIHDFWFEGISIANTWNCIKAHGAQNIVCGRVHMHDCVCGFFATVNEPQVMKNFFIADNLVEGPEPWPDAAEVWANPPEARGIWVGGMGHVVCYNRVHNCKDGIDTAETVPCAAIDFHNNDVSESVDDGTEMDGPERNTRCFLNRYTNTLTGLSFQPVYGGPCYAFKNVCYNFRTEATKLHNNGGTDIHTSGSLIVHNTFVHMGPAWWVHATAPMDDNYSRDNLFIGTEGPEVDFTMVAKDCDFDHDGFGAWSGDLFMHWNGVDYKTPKDAVAKAPIEKHMVLLDAAKLFASGLEPPAKSPIYSAEYEKGYGTLNLNKYPVEKVDARLAPGSKAAHAGVIVQGYGDDPKMGPYLGAFPAGAELPQYGPRPVRK